VRRFALFVVLAMASVTAVVLLQNATKTEPDPVVAGSRSIVAFEVTTNGFVDSADPGETLWGACQASMQSSTLDLSEVGDAYQATVTPALGEHAVRHLRGCLEDAAIDRVQGTVTNVESFDAEGNLLDDDLEPETD
jgi:hypothetical protein